MNGHHRRELAIRTGESDVPIRTFKESDGIDFNTARALGALQNIRDGKGTAIDAATVLRDLNYDSTKLRSLGINPRSGIAQNALGLLKLHPDTLSMVEEGTLPENVAAAIGDAQLDPRRELVTAKEAVRAGL